MVRAKAKLSSATAEQRKTAPWMKHVPSTNPHDDSDDAGLHLKAFLQCVILLWANPRLAMSCSMWLQERTEKQSEAVDTDEFFATEPGTVSQLPVEWVCSYLIDMGVGWSETLLGTIRAYDKAQLFHLLCGYLNVSPMLKLGQFAREKLVVKHAFDMRRAAIGDRFEEITNLQSAQTYVDDLGSIKFGKCGIYKVRLNDDKVVDMVQHKPTGDMAEVTSKDIDGKWFLEKNYSELTAAVQLENSRTDKHVLADYFGKGSGPHKYPTLRGSSTQWDDIMKRAHDKVQRMARKQEERANRSRVSP